MTKDDFAIENGFGNYEEMLSNSFTIIYDQGVFWFSTGVHDGWLAWVDMWQCQQQKLGTFKSFEECQIYLLTFYKNAIEELEKIKLNQFDHLC